MDGSILRVARDVRLCTTCHRITWQPDGVCRLCKKGAVTPS